MIDDETPPPGPAIRWSVPFAPRTTAKGLVTGPHAVAIEQDVIAVATPDGGLPRAPVIRRPQARRRVVTLHDPDTGEERVRLDDARSPRLLGARRLLVDDDAGGPPRIHDLGSGVLIAPLPVERGPEDDGRVASACAGGLIVAAEGERTIRAFRCSDWDVRPEVAWHAEFDAPLTAIAIAGRRVLVLTLRSVSLLHADDGRRVVDDDERPLEARLDRAGLLTASRQGTVVFRDLDGVEAWRREEPVGTVLTVTRRHVIAIEPGRDGVLILDGATGEEQGVVSAPRGSQLAPFFEARHLRTVFGIVDRDVLTLASTRPPSIVVVADLRKARIRWHLARPGLAVAELSPSGGRVHALEIGDDAAQLTCIESAPSGDSGPIQAP